MLDKLSHRGGNWRATVDGTDTAFGALGPKIQRDDLAQLESNRIVRDRAAEGHFAQAETHQDGFILTRDLPGVRPLYYGWTGEGAFCFASEMKGLLAATRDIHEMPPGHAFDGRQLTRHASIVLQPPIENEPPAAIAGELRRRLETAIETRMSNGEAGAWLSGGLDSSAMAALARRRAARLHTFAVGLPGAPDLEFARLTAAFIQSDHHELVVQPREIYLVLEDVIYALESFDALLVRSTVLNYLVARAASDFVPAVFSGEGGDELFAGYDYLKALDPENLPSELVDITNRLHNTALQRVDRCSSAFGLVAHLAFLDPVVVEYALKIPARLKLRNGVEKWILREALHGLLPDAVRQRPKAKFWQGAGVEDLLARHVAEKISDAEFERTRRLPNDWRLNTKEELFYYRIFRAHFGEFSDLTWMGRTKGAPVA